MDLDELRAFLSIVEHGSLLEAARAQGISRTTLRRRSEALETRVGVPLFETTPTGVHVTEAGRALADHGRRIVQDTAAAMTAVREAGTEPMGTVRIVMPLGMPPHAAVPLFAGLRAGHPRLTLQVRMSEEPLAGRLDDVDLVVHFGPRPARGAWITRKLWPLTLWLLAGRSYAAKRGLPETLDELDDHVLFVWHAPEREPNQLPLRSGGSHPVTPQLVTRDAHMLRQCAIAGLGLAFVPDGRLPDPGFSESPVVPVLVNLIGGESALWAAIPEALQNAPKTRVLLKNLETFSRAATHGAGQAPELE